MNPTDLAWLAGAIEGDGSIGMGFHVFRGRVVVKPEINFSNQDENLILAVMQIFEEITGNCGRLCDPIKSGHRKNRPVLVARMNNMDRVAKICRAIQPYLRGEKKAKALLLAEFGESRQIDTHLQAGSGRRAYNQREVEIIKSFYAQSGKGISRNPVVGELLDTVHTQH